MGKRRYLRISEIYKKFNNRRLARRDK